MEVHHQHILRVIMHCIDPVRIYVRGEVDELMTRLRLAVWFSVINCSLQYLAFYIGVLVQILAALLLVQLIAIVPEKTEEGPSA